MIKIKFIQSCDNVIEIALVLLKTRHDITHTTIHSA